MRSRFATWALAGALVTAVALPASAAGESSSRADLAARLTKALRSPDLSLARTAAIAVDVRTGTVIFAHNATLPVVPASNEKLPVSWAALTRLGTGYRFRTEVLGRGARAGRAWRGDLFLRGHGDPTLTAADVESLAATIVGRGIRRVTGRIRGDESAFDGRRGVRGWKPGFVGGESPPLSALVVDRARGWPALSPPLLAARALRDALARRGVVVEGRPGLGVAPSTAVPLAVDWSEPLAVVVKRMNRDSDNFTAEMLLKQLGASDGVPGTSARGAKVVLEEMRAAGISVAGVRIVDGSGLSSLDRVTAESLVGVIRAGRENPRIRSAFLASLAVAGLNGTLSARLAPLAGAVRGKTGTTNLACTLSGLVRGTVAFAVLQNGRPVASWSARAAQDRFVLALASVA